MADVDCSGFLTSPRQFPVAVLNTAQTEGAEEAVPVDLNVYGAADNVGTFVSQVGGGAWVCNGGRRFLREPNELRMDSQPRTD